MTDLLTHTVTFPNDDLRLSSECPLVYSAIIVHQRYNSKEDKITALVGLPSRKSSH
jgi:hypothetical protein